MKWTIPGTFVVNELLSVFEYCIKLMWKISLKHVKNIFTKATVIIY